MFQSIFSTGLGGQGIITLANLISGVASEQGFKVTLFNAKGMAQRGGRVTSEIRLTDDPKLEFGARISSGRADILIGMEIGETINSLSFLMEGGTVILLDYAYVPPDMVLKKQPYLSLDQARELFLQRTQSVFAVQKPAGPHNMYLLGVFTAVAPSANQALSFYSAASMEQAIGARLKRGADENLKTFKAGYAYGRSLLARV